MKFQTKPTNLATDPIAVFESLVNSHDNCFLLETLADKYQPQTTGQSYIGVVPSHVYAARANVFFTDGKAQKSQNSYEHLRRKINFYQKQLPEGYVGGLVGYFSHEAIKYIEPSLNFPYQREFPDFQFAEYPDGLVFKYGKKPKYFHYGQDRLDLYEADAKQGHDLEIKFMTTAKDFASYSRMIDKARHDIQNGRVFQVVLANKYVYRFKGSSLLQLYKELRRINPSPFMFFIKFGNVVTLGASPELLSHTTPNGEAYLEALAGTIRRGKNAAEDAELADKLLNDEKEIAEHSMLVDLARNDLGRICEIGSIKVEDLMYIKKASHVQHISSLVGGRLKSSYDAFDTLAASFPAGTLSGAPKIEAIKMIEELEGYERGPYGGTIGYFSYNGDSEQAVNIRAISAVDNKLVMHSGSGIVFDSNAKREYEEVSEKKTAMERAMSPFLQEGAL